MQQLPNSEAVSRIALDDGEWDKRDLRNRLKLDIWNVSDALKTLVWSDFSSEEKKQACKENYRLLTEQWNNSRCAPIHTGGFTFDSVREFTESPAWFIDWALSKDFRPAWLTWAIENGLYGTAAPAVMVEAVHDEVNNTGRMPVSRQQAQDNEILLWIKSNNYDPLKFPVPLQGKAGVKKDCRDELCKNKQIFLSISVFNTAWDRLRCNRKIIDEINVSR